MPFLIHLLPKCQLSLVYPYSPEKPVLMKKLLLWNFKSLFNLVASMKISELELTGCHYQ
jgi:hypothetical protein